MARKVTTESCAAFTAGVSLSKSNTTVYGGRVVIDGESREGVILALHGNPIAFRPAGTTELWISSGDYPLSLTTRERLNGLPGVQVWQHRHKAHVTTALYQSTDWDGDWVRAS